MALCVDGTAEGFVVDRLAGRSFHQVCTAEAHERSALDHQNYVAQCRQVRTAGDAHSHHGRDLRHLEVMPHYRVVIKDACGTVLSRENAALIRQIDARRIDEIDDRHTIAHRDLLRPQDLLDSFGIPRTGLDRRVICDNDTFASMDLADDRDDRRRRSLAVVLVIGDKKADLLRERVFVEKQLDTLAGGQFALGVDLFDLRRAAAEQELMLKPLVFDGQFAKPGFWVVEFHAKVLFVCGPVVKPFFEFVCRVSRISRDHVEFVFVIIPNDVGAGSLFCSGN